MSFQAKKCICPENLFSRYPFLLQQSFPENLIGKLRIAYSGGADYYNIDLIVKSGVWPVTVATTLLKPGGYQRFTQMAEKVMADGVKEWKGIDVAALEQLAEDAKKDAHHVKSIKPLPKRKTDSEVPLP